MNPATEWAYNVFLASRMSMHHFGEVCGFSGSNVRQWEKGRSTPWMKTLEKISDAFEISIPDEVREAALQNEKEDMERRKLILDLGRKKAIRKIAEQKIIKKTWHFDGDHKEFCSKKHCAWKSYDGKCHMPTCMEKIEKG